RRRADRGPVLRQQRDEVLGLHRRHVLSCLVGAVAARTRQATVTTAMMAAATTAATAVVVDSGSPVARPMAIQDRPHTRVAAGARRPRPTRASATPTAATMAS